VLILANEAIGDETFLREIGRHIEGRPAEVRIVAPTLVKSGLDVLTGDVDDERAEAHRRLEATIAALDRNGLEASGTVGEADPNVALEDGLRLFPADEVVIIARSGEQAAWAEHDVVEQAHSRLTIPITYIEVDSDSPGPAVKDMEGIAPAGPGAGDEDDGRVDREAAETFPASDPPANY
jgi:hypothetical protein